MRWIIMLIMSFNLVAGTRIAKAEKTYPGECCPKYCRAMSEVSKIQDDGNREYVETYSFGKLTIPPSVIRRESPDGYFHICAGFTDHNVQVKCIFVPPLM